jgi:hypothetical protein
VERGRENILDPRSFETIATRSAIQDVGSMASAWPRVHAEMPKSRGSIPSTMGNDKTHTMTGKKH